MWAWPMAQGRAMAGGWGRPSCPHTPGQECGLLAAAPGQAHFLGSCNPWGVEQHLSLSPAELCSQAVSSLY